MLENYFLAVYKIKLNSYTSKSYELHNMVELPYRGTQRFSRSQTSTQQEVKRQNSREPLGTYVRSFKCADPVKVSKSKYDSDISITASDWIGTFKGRQRVPRGSPSFRLCLTLSGYQSRTACLWHKLHLIPNLLSEEKEHDT